MKKQTNAHNYRAAVAEATPSRRRASLAPSAPVSSSTDRADRAAAALTGAAVGSCRPYSPAPTDGGGYSAWAATARVEGRPYSLRDYLRDVSSRVAEVGVYPTSIASAIDDAISSRGERTATILRALRAHLVRTDGHEIGTLLADGFCGWVTPAGYMVLTPEECAGRVRVARRLAAYVAASIPAAYAEDGSLAPGVVALPDGGGVVLGSSRIAGGLRATSWGRTPRLLGSGPTVGKLVASSFGSWMAWLRWAYNHDECLDHEEIRARYAAADSVLRYSAPGRRSSSRAEDAKDAKVKAVCASLTPEEVAALPPALRAALGL